MSDLNISCIQADLIWEDCSKNLDHFDQILKSVDAQSDLIILPEMFASGFSMEPKKIAQDASSGPAVKWMVEKAKKLQKAICGSLAVQEGDQFFNRFYFVYPEGKIETYNKRHLFSLAKEEEHYTAGTEQKTIEYKGFIIGLNICYDLRFPVWSRNTNHYDLLINVANWPAKRAHPWKTLLMARAIENQAYVAGVNRAGTDGNEHYYSGDSSIVNFDGDLLQQISDREGIIEQKLSLSKLKKFRENFTFLADQDSFIIQ